MPSFFTCLVLLQIIVCIPFTALAKTADAPFFYLSTTTYEPVYSALSPRELRAQADAGNAPAMVTLGEIGWDVAIATYAEWFRKAAEMGDINGQAMYGKALLERGKDRKRACELLEQAADKGNSNAQQILHRLFLIEGKLVPLEKLELWLPLAIGENPLMIDSLHMLKNYSPEAVADFMNRLRQKAENSDVTAAYMLGFCNAHGIGMAESKAESTRWLKQATTDGHGRAAWMLYGAFSDAEEHVQAAFWLARAAKNGYDHALRQIADFVSARGQRKDGIPAAAPYLIRAAELGGVDAAIQLAEWCRRGDLPGGSEEAETWYARAAESGYTSAWDDIRDMYEKAGDAKRAAHWAERAAEEEKPFTSEALRLLTP